MLRNTACGMLGTRPTSARMPAVMARVRGEFSICAPICTPNEEQVLRNDGSYPSGHSAIGWGWALVLTQVAPDRANEVLARGRAFANSRVICNVHWLSDTEEGRTMASAVVAKLQSDATFQTDLAAAKAEVAAARAKGLKPDGDCAAEAAQLAAG